MKKLLFVLFIVFSESVLCGEESFLHLNKIISKLERGNIVSGIWVSSLHPSNAAGIVLQNGFPKNEESLTRPMIDFIIIDMEHGPFDMVELRNFLLALNSKREVYIKGNLQPNIATLVRIAAEGNESVHSMIKQVLDVGAHGVVVPHIRTAAEAEKVVSACRYCQPKSSQIKEPEGTRGAGPMFCSYLWGLTREEYVKRADVWPLNPYGDIFAVIMIEDEEGVKNINNILNVKGIGAVLFGPYDFSFSSGHYGRDHPEVMENLKKVKDACDRNNLPLIGFCNSDNIQDKIDEKYNILLIGSDVGHDGGFQKVLEKMRSEGLTSNGAIKQCR